MTLQPFTIEAYERGEEVVYRDGKTPDEICVFKTTKHDPYPIITVRKGSKASHGIDGKVNANHYNSYMDLMINSKVVEKYCNVYNDGSFGDWHERLEDLKNLPNKKYALHIKGFFINGQIVNIEPIKP